MINVAANFADTLRRPQSGDSTEAVVIDSVREELRDFYGEADDRLPTALAELVQRLDGAEARPGLTA
ncbi:MAG: hypothetical protein INR70_15215 [Parafilimonas terrae]|jgi:hypothetical protein|nr:hypothetical protein [Parafilimonas terrae]